MSLKKIIPLAIFIVTAIALTIWGYPLIKGRYFEDKTGQQKNDTSGQNASNENRLPEENSNVGIDGSDSNIDAAPAPEKTPLTKIKRGDCLDGCKRFSNGQEFTYCKQVCGLERIQDNPEDCSGKSGLEKDYCFKDLAIKNQDFKICEKVSDKSIKETCKNRITEDILEKQKLQ